MNREKNDIQWSKENIDLKKNDLFWQKKITNGKLYGL